MKFKAIVKGEKHCKIELPEEVLEEMNIRKGSLLGVDVVEIEDETEES